MKKQQIKARYEIRKALCEEKGVIFNLTLSEFSKLCKSKKCAYSGEEFNEDIGTCCRESVMIDPKKGFVKGNVVFVKSRYNFNCLSKEDFSDCFITRRTELKSLQDELLKESLKNKEALVDKKERWNELQKLYEQLFDEIESHETSQRSYENDIDKVSNQLNELKAAEEGCAKLQKLSFLQRLKLKMFGKI